jgi:hypothetical protein
VFELGPGQTREHDIDLVWGGTISGHVVDGRGAPVEGAMVWFRAGMTSHCLTDAAGSFVCGGLAGDTYAVTVFPTDGAANAFRFIDAPGTFALRDGDARVDGVRLVIDPSLLAIDGRVVDASGAPVPDVAVRAFGVDRTPRFSFQLSSGTITDDDGRFHLAELSAGDYSVEVEQRDLAARRTVAAGSQAVVLVLDRSRCDAAGGHELAAHVTRPPAPVIWDRSIELVGWSVPAEAKVGTPVEITLVFRALRSIDRDWTVFAHVDSSSLRVNGDHGPGDGWCPTTHWQASETITDRATLHFEHAGRYAVTIGFFTGKAPAWENLSLSAVPTAMQDTKQPGVHVADILVKE